MLIISDSILLAGMLGDESVGKQQVVVCQLLEELLGQPVGWCVVFIEVDARLKLSDVGSLHLRLLLFQLLDKIFEIESILWLELLFLLF